MRASVCFVSCVCVCVCVSLVYVGWMGVECRADLFPSISGFSFAFLTRQGWPGSLWGSQGGFKKGALEKQTSTNKIVHSI